MTDRKTERYKAEHTDSGSKEAAGRRIRMVALDLDGTTLNDDKQISERTVEAFRKAMEQGVHIVVSTGRTYGSLPQQLFFIEGLEYAVTSNGAHITEIAGRKLIYEDYIPSAAIETIEKLLRNTGISVEVFVKGRAYIDRREYEEVLTMGSSYRDAEYIKTTRTPVPDILDFMLAHKETVENINITFEFLEEKEQWREVLEQIEGTTLTSSFIHNFEVGGRSTSKAEALRWLMRRLDVSADELMAVGDSPNDEEMIKLAGLGVAVANARESTKETADCITASNQEDGVAKAIEKFVLRDSAQ